MRHIVGIVVLGALECGSSTRVPERPARVPKSAVWTGGVDGGAWILCHQPLEPADVFDCQVFNDQTGNLEAKGSFCYEPRDGHPRTIASLEAQYTSWDDKRIHLKGNRALVLCRKFSRPSTAPLEPHQEPGDFPLPNGY